MDVRKYAAVAALLLVLPNVAASFRTENFVVSARTPGFAKQVAETAEQLRHDLAIQWLGEPLPRWREPCPIQVNDGPRLGAGGQTSFAFDGGRPFGWEMIVQGTQQRILDSVLPHEITHTIFATHFGRPLPRWADEGACTTVEDISERSKQHRLLIEFLTHDRGIAFNKMFAMREYPRDILPLYSQGYSLARFLIQQGGHRKFVQYVGDGMDSNNWTQSTKRHYGYASLSELQNAWLQWVKEGSPMIAQPISARPAGYQVAASSNAPVTPGAGRKAADADAMVDVQLPAAVARPFAPGSTGRVLLAGSRPAKAIEAVASRPTRAPQRMARPQGYQSVGQQVHEWSADSTRTAR